MTDATATKVTRQQRRAARRQAASTVMPPEGVPLRLPVAGLGVRLGAQVTDVGITFAFAAALIYGISFAINPDGTTIFGLAAFLFFVVRVPYYILSETLMNGQTIGKRLLKIRVVSHRGGPLTTHAIVLRNMLKEAEVFLPASFVLQIDLVSSVSALFMGLWIAIAVLIPLLNVHRMRLGDMLAGTHVVAMPNAILLSDVARTRERDAQHNHTFRFLPHQLDHYGRYELQTLETLLRAQSQPQTPDSYSSETIAKVVARIRKKISYAEAVPTDAHLAFLQAFYNAQRAHLEQRQLFGERREDKHFSSSSAEE